MSEKQLLEKITTSGLIKKNDRIIIGLSGGPDSVALTILLNRLKSKFNLSIHLAHINYHLRGKESEKDEIFCRNLAAKLGLPIFVNSVNIASSKKNSQSFQALAREIRMHYFFKLAKKYNVNKIALAHQADDQAETILMKLLRGSGREGLTGISKNRLLRDKINLIHPLLSMSRQEILEFLKKENIKFRVDASNLKTIYLRNKIRLKLIPLIEKDYQPQIKGVLNNMAEIMAGENDYLEKIAEQTLKKLIVEETPGRFLAINAEKLKKIHPSLQTRILQLCVQKFTSGYNIDFRKICCLQNILTKNKAKLNIKGKFIAEHINNKLVFSYNKKKVSLKYKPFIFKLKIPGKTNLRQMNLLVQTKLMKNLPAIEKRKDIAFFSRQKLKQPLSIRSRKNGDYFFPRGIPGRKKLQDFFVDEKIPFEKRNHIPLLISGKNILWIIGYRLDKRFLAAKNDEKIISVKINCYKTQNVI